MEVDYDKSGSEKKILRKQHYRGHAEVIELLSWCCYNLISEDQGRFFSRLHKRLARSLFAILEYIKPLTPLLFRLTVYFRKDVHNSTMRELREAGQADIVFVTGNTAPSFRYRCANMMEALALAGLQARAIDARVLGLFLNLRPRTKVFVIFRETINPPVLRLRRHIEKIEGMMLYDIDDLLFLPSETDYLDQVNAKVVESHPGLAFLFHKDIFPKYQRAMALADACCGPTPLLCEEMERLVGLPSYLIPNTVNLAQIDLADELLARKNNDDAVACADSTIQISYWPGTQTHYFDFQECESALLDLMEDYPSLVFVTSELIILSGPRWEALAPRVVQHPFMDYLTLLRFQSEVQINIAPIDLRHRFNHAKSQLKVFEAGLVKVPTVASPTEAMKLALDNGVDGFFATSHDEWYSSLEALIHDPTLRHKMGCRARKRTLQMFSVPAIVHRVERLYR